MQYGIAIRRALPYRIVMQTVVETSIFTRRDNALLSREERVELINLMATDPKAGDPRHGRHPQVAVCRGRSG